MASITEKEAVNYEDRTKVAQVIYTRLDMGMNLGMDVTTYYGVGKSMTETLKQQQQLEKLLLSEDLEELNDLTGHFNIFNALKLQNNEIRHSNFLAWLMTPYETHKLGSYFLKEFLKEAIKDYSLDENIALSLKDIAFCNFDDTEVKRVYKNIDLLLINHTNNFVCIIENKIWTGEHDCQLERFGDIVDNEFKD